MNYTLQEIADICGGTIQGGPSLNNKIQSVAWDSRQLIPDPNTIFIAINGSNHDAHQFLSDIEKQGIQFFLVSKQHFTLNKKSQANFLVVEDSLLALQHLAAHHRNRYKLPVIGITGSNGKTTIKEWLGELLNAHLDICKSPKSYNSKLGVPLSLLQLNKKHQIGIFETGISKPNEMTLLADLIKPDFALLTNLGTAHDEGFESRSEKFKEKMLLLKKSTQIFLVEDDNELTHKIKDEFKEEQLIKLGKSSDAFIQTIKFEKQKKGYSFSFNFKDTEQLLFLPFSDQAALSNISYCILIYCYIRRADPVGSIIKDLQKGLNELSPLAMRLEIIDGAFNSSIINDTYTNDLDSLEVALQHLVRHNNAGKKIIILSDLLQLNAANEEQVYELIASKIIAVNPELFVGIGYAIKRLEEKLKEVNIQTLFFDSKSLFKQQIDLQLFEQASILIKGARKYAFEDLVDFIAEKQHRTYLEINLNAIRENLAFFRSSVGKRCKTLTMVKAEAYGGGDHEIARLLEQERVDYLGVAYVDEGIKLRKAGIQTPILVLNVSAHEFERCIHYRLEPEIHAIEQLKALAIAAKSVIHPVFFHLKIETGMNRLGFRTDDLGMVLDLYKKTEKLKLRSVFSHLASSESNQELSFTQSQFDNFKKAITILESNLEETFEQHILNTAGISKYPDMHLDMVRLGIGLFGVGNNPDIQNQLKLAFRLKATVTAVSKVKANESIGYGRLGQTKQDSYIATISIGYADGLLRKAGNNRFSVLINGQYYPIIGNVCMDMCMVDLGSTTLVQAGDEVIIFDDNKSLNALSDALDTIPYEVLTNISQRVRRKYIQD